MSASVTPLRAKPPERSLNHLTIPARIKAKAEAFCSDADKVRRALLTSPSCPETTYAEAVALLDRKRP